MASVTKLTKRITSDRLGFAGPDILSLQTQWPCFNKLYQKLLRIPGVKESIKTPVAAAVASNGD